MGISKSPYRYIQQFLTQILEIINNNNNKRAIDINKNKNINNYKI